MSQHASLSCCVLVASATMILMMLSTSNFARAQQVTSISHSTVPVSGGMSITLYGSSFPVAEPTWIVFLVGRYDVVPVSQCAVDIFKSTSTRAVCESLPVFPVVSAANVSLFQPSTSYFVGLKTSSSTEKYFYTAAALQVTTSVEGALLIKTPSFLATASTKQTVYVQIGGNASGDILYSTKGEIDLVLSDASSGSSATCNLIQAHSLSASQLDGIHNSAVFPFECPTGMPAGYYMATLNVGGSSASVVKSNLPQVIRYGPSLNVFTTFVPPVVSAVSPSTVSSATTITFTITGTGFSPSNTDNVITVGGSPCEVQTSSPTSIICRGIATATTAVSLAEGGSGFLRRFFTTSSSTISLSVLRASIPTGDLAATAANLLANLVVSDLDFPIGSLAAAASGLTVPFSVVHEGFLTPKVSGVYQFYCVGSDSAVLQIFSGSSWSDLCSATGSSLDLARQFADQTSAVSTERTLTSGTAIKIRAVFGVSDLTSSFAKFSMSLNQTTVTNAGTPKVTVPHVVRVVATKTAGSTSAFTMEIGSINPVTVDVEATTDCGTLPSIAQAIRSASSGQYGTQQSLVETASSCTWFIEFVGDSSTLATVSVSGATDVAVTIVLQGSNKWFWDAIPAYLFTAPHDLSGLATQGVVSVTSRGIKAFHSRGANVLLPFTVAPTLAAPNTCTVSPLQLATSGLTVNVTSSAFMVTNPTLDFVSYNGLYTSVENTLTMNTSTVYSTTVPSTLPSSAYAVYLNQGAFGRILCGSVVQGFQAILISPTSGTRYGGTRLTITGSNFPTNLAGFSIFIGGASCTAFYATATSIQCRTTAMLSTPTEVPVSTGAAATTFFVRMYANQTNLPSALTADYTSYAPFGGSLAPRFSYSLTGVPFVTSITPITGSGGKRNTVTIVGTSLTSVAFSLCNANLTTCSPIICPTASRTVTQAICTTPRLPPTTYYVMGRTTSGRTNANVTFHSILFVNSTSPSFLSPSGGSVVTITGQGFGAGVTVSVGQAACAVNFVNDTTILCTTIGPIGDASAVPVVRLPTIASRNALVPNSTGVAIQAVFSDSEAEPTVPYFYPRMGNGVGSTITITALNFPAELASPDMVTVKIGNTPCETYLVDTDSDPALIYCNRTHSAPAGADPLRVWLGDFGLLSPGTANAEVPFVATTYTHTLAVNSIAPLTGSTAGGTYITVEGLGFGTTNFSIKMGTVACNAGSAYSGTTLSVDRVVCIMDPSSTLGSNQTEFIYIQSREVISIFGAKFNFLTSSTALLTKASPLTGNAGTTISLSVDNIASTADVQALLLVGVEVNVSYVALDNSFAVILPSLPAFRSPLQMKTASGYSRSASSIVFVSYPSISSIVPQQANSAGGTLITVYGQRFGRPGFADNLKVIICGNPCELVSYSLTNITCIAPPLRNLNSVSGSVAAFVTPYTATYTGTASSASEGSALAANVFDSDTSTGLILTRSSAGLVVDLNLGDYQSAHILKVSFFPTKGYEAYLVGAAIQSSSDGATWTTLSTLASVSPGWNTISYQAKTLYTQYIRISPTSAASMMGLQEVRVYGVRGAAAAVTFCPLIVTMKPPGSDLMSTCLQQPLLCINVDTSVRITFTTTFSPTITRIQPETATTRGGNTINLYGSFPTVSTTDITVVAGGLPCTVTSAGSAQIDCTTTAAYIDTAPSQQTTLSITGFGAASLTTPPFFLAESWSSPDAWSFSTVPVAGSIVIIPAGVTVVLDVSPPALGGLIVYGTLLTTADINIAITLESGFILVQDTGAIRIGTSTNPYSSSLTISLAPSSIVDPVFGKSFLAVNGGTMTLSGLATSSVYGPLSTTANPGDRYVSISGITTWSSGSTIVIPSSTASMDETEVRLVTATSINGTNTLFYFATPLEYTHNQGVETNSLALSASYTAVVGLLSRTVKVTSTDASNRGYVVVAPSQNGVQPSVTLYYCEFSFLGQRGQARRHALTFVNVQAPSAVTLTGVSVHRSQNRGIHFENSQHIVSTSVLVFDTVGHGISSDENAQTRFISITSSYVASSKAGETFDPKASNYYFTHPNVNISSSYAIGASFAGYAFHLEQYNNDTATCPQDAVFGTFTRNYAQATDVGFTVYPAHAQRTTPCGVGSPISNPTKTTSVTLLQFFRNRRHIDLGEMGSWTIASTWMMDATDVSIAVGAVSSGLLTITSTHIVAHSTLTLNSGVFTPFNASMGVRGIKFPDKSGNVLVATVYFAGFSGTVLGVAHVAMTVCERCAAPFVNALPGYRNYVRSVQFVQTGNAVYFKFFPPYNSLVLDMDGSFGGSSNSTILATASHLTPITACTALDTTMFSTATPATSALMTCPGTFAMHLVRVTASNAGAPIAVASTGGATFYPTKPSTLVPGWFDAVVIIPSGSVTIDSVSVNVSVYNFSIAIGVANWDRVIVSVPTSMRTMSGQLGIRFNFTVSTYSVDVFARALQYTRGQLLQPILSSTDVFTSTIPTYIGAPTSAAPTANVTTTFVQPLEVFISVASAAKSDGVPLIFDLQSSRCAESTTCISQGKASSSSTNYPWTDVRSWSNTGTVPTAGSVAVIPRGTTITLASATASLKALIIEGTLEFHFRLGGTLTANFIIINGGTLRIGSSSEPFAPRAYINLVRNPSVPPMSVTSSITVESGTLLNMGSLQLYGTPKSVPWTSLGALLGASSSTVTTADVLDWNVDEIVAVSSSNYNYSLTEYMQIGQLAADNRGFTSRAPSALQHDWYTMTINDNTKVTTAAKLAVLNRTITIRGTGTEPGCQILFAERPTATFGAAGTISNVHIEGCGIKNGTKYNSTTGAAIVLRDVKRSSVTISQSSIHNSIASAISLENSINVRVTSNGIVGTRGSSMVFDSRSESNTVTGNLIFSTFFSDAILDDPATPAAHCSFDSRYSLNTFQSNVAAGSASEGFCVQLPDCSDTAHKNTGNEAHSCVVGHFTSHVGSTISCVSINDFHGWHNSFIGIYSAVGANSHILTSALHDNHIQVIVGRAGSGTNKIQSTVIGGRAGYFDDLSCSMTQCVANRIYGTCWERAEQLRDGSRSYLQGEIGVLVIPFLLETPTAEYSRAITAEPFFRYDASAVSPNFSSNELNNNIYYYWYRGNDFGRCSGSTTIAVDGYATLRLPTTLIANTSWVTYNDDARVYIPAPVAIWKTQVTMCDGRQCDALLHVAITDLDGAFFSQAMATSAISNYVPATRTCVENIIWNAYMCASNAVGQLTARDFPSNTMDSYNLEPLSIREDQQEDIVDYTYLPPKCAAFAASTDPCALAIDRAHQFNPLLRLNLRYDVDFFVEAPRRLRFTLDSCAYPLGRVELRVKFPPSALLTVWVYDDKESTVGYLADALTNLVLSDSPVGSHYYDVATERLRLIIQCGYTVEVHTVVYATVAMLLQTSVEDFAYQTSEDFITNVSDYLVLDSSRISLEAVYPGSAVAVMQLKGDDEADYLPSSSSTEVNNYVLSLIGYSNAEISENLGFPVLQTVAAAWANDQPTTVAPTQVSFSLSVGLIVSIAVVSFVIFLLLIILQWRLFVMIVNYTDESDEKDADEELLDEEDEEEQKKAMENLGNEKPHISVDVARTTTEPPAEDGIMVFDHTEQVI